MGVPGEIRGFWQAHQDYGKLTWYELFTPTINLARNGFKVSNTLEEAILLKEEEIRNSTSLRLVYGCVHTCLEMHSEFQRFHPPTSAANY